MNSNTIRLISTILLVGCVGLYSWLSMRSEPRLTTIPFVPYSWAFFFDLKPLARSFPAFFVLGILAAGAVAGLGGRWQCAPLALCLFAPVLKDVAQMATATRHFDFVSTLLGKAGAAAGWGFGTALLRWLKL
jgi:hypothetical protein